MDKRSVLKEINSPDGEVNLWGDKSGCFTSAIGEFRSIDSQKIITDFDQRAFQDFISNYISTKWVDALNMQMLERKMLLLEEQIRHSQNSKPKVVVINTLMSEPVIVKTPIYITISNVDDSYIAEFSDANISASGDTPDEALTNIKDIICAKYLLFKKHRVEELGKKIYQQYLILCQYIEGAD